MYINYTSLRQLNMTLEYRNRNTNVDAYMSLDAAQNSEPIADWVNKELSNPHSTINLATMFSGIGAVEFALRRLKLKTNIIFASDNDNFVKESYFSNYNKVHYDRHCMTKGNI